MRPRPYPHEPVSFKEANEHLGRAQFRLDQAVQNHLDQDEITTLTILRDAWAQHIEKMREKRVGSAG